MCNKYPNKVCSYLLEANANAYLNLVAFKFQYSSENVFAFWATIAVAKIALNVTQFLSWLLFNGLFWYASSTHFQCDQGNIFRPDKKNNADLVTLTWITGILASFIIKRCQKYYSKTDLDVRNLNSQPEEFFAMV